MISTTVEGGHVYRNLMSLSSGRSHWVIIYLMNLQNRPMMLANRFDTQRIRTLSYSNSLFLRFSSSSSSSSNTSSSNTSSSNTSSSNTRSSNDGRGRLDVEESTHLKWLCWKCQYENNISGKIFHFFCNNCSTIRSPQSLTFDQNNADQIFKLFELSPIQFDIPIHHVESTYRKLQKLLHPDKYATATEKERSNAAHFSSMVSIAYQSLKEPLSRSQLILEYFLKNQSTHWTEKHHPQIFENQPSDVQDHHHLNDKVDDPQLLFEILELEEKIEDLKDPSEAEKLHNDVVREHDQCLNKLSESFRHQDLLQARRILQRCQLTNRIVQKLKYWKLDNENNDQQQNNKDNND